MRKSRPKRQPSGETPSRPARPQRPLGSMDSETLYQDIFENANDAIALFSLDGVITAVNRGAERLLGWAREELIGQPVSKVATPAAVALAEARSRRFRAGQKLPSSLFEAELIRKDGSTIVVEARTRAIRDATGTLVGYQGIYRDLTERKQAEEALRQSEERYRSIFEACPDLVYLTDPGGRLLDANPALVRWVGLTREDLRGKHFLEFFAGDNRDELRQKAAELARGAPIRDFVVKAKNAQGEIRAFEVNALPLHDQRGTLTAYLSIARDITARLEVERALRESQYLRARIADMLPDLVYVYDLSARRLRMVNRQVTAVLGYAPDEVQGKTGPVFGDLLHPDDVAPNTARAQAWATAETGAFAESEYRVRHVSGEYRWLRSRETVLTRSPEGVPLEILGLARDVTERKRLGRLMQQRKMTLKELGPRVQHFRESLKLTQAEFAARFGTFNQQQISNYETGRIDVPLELLLGIREQGYPLDVVLGEGSTEALEETIVYLTASYRERVVSQQLARVLLQLLDLDVAKMERALREVGHPIPPLVGEQKRVVEQLADVEKLTG
jgi:PAS domain S-box-containing protein